MVEFGDDECAFLHLFMKIGLTGGIGCGKSTAGKLFQENGFQRCDVDEIVRERLRSDAEVHRAVSERFGASFVNKEGVDRKKMAEIVFSDESALKWLEQLLHPLVQSEWKSLMANDPQTNWCIEIPLLFEKNLEKHFDFTVCVWSSPAIQLSRLSSRGLTREQALARNALQMPLSEKVERSDFVLSNNGSESFLREQITYFVDHWVPN